jgi:hypothetical protein
MRRLVRWLPFEPADALEKWRRVCNDASIFGQRPAEPQDHREPGESFVDLASGFAFPRPLTTK